MSAEQTPAGNNRLRTGIIVLTCICLVSGAVLSLTYWYFKADIQANAQSAYNKALAEVLGPAETYPTLGEYPDGAPHDDIVYVNATPEGTLYAASATAQGYQSKVRVLVSVRAPAPSAPVGDDPVIYSMIVVESGETPGLGENIRAVEKDISIYAAIAGKESAAKRPWFQEQFSGKKFSDLVVEKRKDTPKIAALTGATITSRAATEATKDAVQKIIKRSAEVYGK